MCQFREGRFLPLVRCEADLRSQLSLRQAEPLPKAQECAWFGNSACETFINRSTKGYELFFVFPLILLHDSQSGAHYFTSVRKPACFHSRGDELVEFGRQVYVARRHMPPLVQYKQIGILCQSAELVYEPMPLVLC